MSSESKGNDVVFCSNSLISTSIRRQQRFDMLMLASQMRARLKVHLTAMLSNFPLILRDVVLQNTNKENNK